MKDVHGGNIWEASARAGLALDEIIDFSASINPLGIARSAADAVKSGLSLTGPYPDPDSKALVAAISEGHGVEVPHILAGNGSTEFIFLLPRILKPKKALIAEPAFSEYRAALSLGGCRVDSVTARRSAGFSLDLSRLDVMLKCGYDIFILANPANPTGVVLEKQAVLEVARLCARHSTTLVVDEAFADFCEGVSIKAEAGRLKNTIVLRSMTKFFSMAGLRLGFMVSNPRLIKAFAKEKPPWSVNTLASLAGAAALRDNRYAEKTLRWLSIERPALFEGMRAIKGITPYPSAANYIMARIERPQIDAPALRDALFRKKILIRELAAFRGLGRSYLRVAVRSAVDNRLLIEAMKEALA
ncbi:MAG: threonine-phosphate decarboxylase CobD [Deltaproteobacteria bacterium]